MDFEIFEFNFLDGACLNHIEYTISILTKGVKMEMVYSMRKKNFFTSLKKYSCSKKSLSDGIKLLINEGREGDVVMVRTACTHTHIYILQNSTHLCTQKIACAIVLPSQFHD